MNYKTIIKRKKYALMEIFLLIMTAIFKINAKAQWQWINVPSESVVKKAKATFNTLERKYIHVGQDRDLEVLWDGEMVRIISNPLSDSYPLYDGVAQYPKPFVTYAEQTATLQEKGYQHLLQAGLKDAADYGNDIFFDLVLHPQNFEERSFMDQTCR